MVTIFLPLAANLSCIASGVGNLALSHVKYLYRGGALVSEARLCQCKGMCAEQLYNNYVE